MPNPLFSAKSICVILQRNSGKSVKYLNKNHSSIPVFSQGNTLCLCWWWEGRHAWKLFFQWFQPGGPSGSFNVWCCIMQYTTRLLVFSWRDLSRLSQLHQCDQQMLYQIDFFESSLRSLSLGTLASVFLQKTYLAKFPHMQPCNQETLKGQIYVRS